MQPENTHLALFQGKHIRRTIHQDEWWFSIIDVIAVLTQSDRPRKYWNDLKVRLTREGYAEVSEKIGQLKLEAPDGKLRETDCANTQGFAPNKQAAREGGSIAGNARKELERKSGQKVSTPINYLKEPQNAKRLKK